MNVHGHATAAAFLARTGAWLRKREVENSLILGLSARRADREHNGRTDLSEPAWLFATIHDRRDRLPRGAAMMTPGYPLLLAGGEQFPSACSALVSWLRRQSWHISGVLGRVEFATCFADTWCRQTDQQASVVREERIHRIKQDAVRAPTDVEGSLRSAGKDDRAVIIRWMRRFHDEAVPEDPLPNLERLTARHLQEGSIFFWDNGSPVSMAIHVRSAQKTASISGVFTPRAERGNGYASACVAALCERLLTREFTSCVLYADLANPISNRIYRQVGFSPVCDVRHLAFGSPHSSCRDKKIIP